MYLLRESLYERRDRKLGYSWDAIRNFGTVEIEQEELFSRPEFEVFHTNNDKDTFAQELGWRYNIDKQVYYRLKGF